MSWFAAHIVMFVKFKVSRQRQFPVWENIVLIEANTEAEAFEKAEQRGRLDESDDDGTFRWGDQPATWVFAGIRKLTACENVGSRPSDGTEVSYLELELNSQEAIDKFVAGEQVQLWVNEQFRDRNETKPTKKVQQRRRSPV